MILPNSVIRVSPPRQRHFNGSVKVIRPSFGTFASTIFLRNIPSALQFGSLAFLGATNGVPAEMQLFIANQSVQWRESTLSIDLILGTVGKCTFTIDSNTSGQATAYRPGAYDEVVFYRRGIRRFGGFVQSVQDNLTPGTNSHETLVTCVDYMGYLDRVIVAGLYNLVGGFFFALDVILDLIPTYLAQFGVTFAGFATQGPVFGQALFHYITAAQAITQLLSTGSGFYVWIDASKRLHLYYAGAPAPGGVGVAPYSLTDTSRNYLDFQISVDSTLYRNKQWVLPSANVLSLRIETFIGDGSTTSFITHYALNNTPVVTVNGFPQTVATLFGSMPAGWSWYFIAGDRGVFQRGGSAPLQPTDTLQIAYPNPFSLAVSAENDTEIAARGLVEAIFQPQNVIDVASAQALATSLLNAFCPNPPQTIVFTTEEIDAASGLYASADDGRWLLPGMTIQVTKTLPAAAGFYTVQEIVSQEYGLTEFKHTVTVQSNQGNLNPQLGYATLAGQALAASNNNATETAGVALAVTVQGITNPGLATGDTGASYIFQYDGVFSYWSIFFPNTPPVGADIVVDALINGVSILPASAAFKIILPAGQSTEAQGYMFLSNNLAVHKGDVMTWNVLQVGSTTPGSDGQVKVVTVR